MEIVSFENAKKLKEKGFKEKCLLHYESTGGFYSNSIDTYDRPNQELDYSDFLKCFNEGNSIGLIDAPTISQVLKWLREEKNIEVVASFSYRNKVWGYQVGDMTLLEDSILSYDYSFPTYELAALAGIEYVIDNLI